MNQENHPPSLYGESDSLKGQSHFEFNPDEYRHYLEGEGLSPEQEEELLSILWTIIVQFAQMGFGIDPISLILKEKEKGGADEAT